MRFRFRLQTGPESASVTYTPKSGPPALGDPQAGGGSCVAPAQALGEEKHPVPYGPSSPLQFVELRDSRPRTQGDSNSPPPGPGNSLVEGATAVVTGSWAPVRCPEVPGVGRPSAPPHPGIPAERPNFPAGLRVTALHARGAAGQGSPLATRGRLAGAGVVRDLRSGGRDSASATKLFIIKEKDVSLLLSFSLPLGRARPAQNLSLLQNLG